nr:methyltransferase domain-containing protein [Methanofollis sp. W23]
MLPWQGYWNKRNNGGHRRQEERFLQKEAREKLFHLEHGRSLLDFGCGSADLLVYYTQNFSDVVGVDFSTSMLASAERRLEKFGVSDVTLIEADDRTMWEHLDGDTFDRITSAGVIQCLDQDRLENFIIQAQDRLSPEGSIVLFDGLDPRIYPLFHLGVINREARRGPGTAILAWKYSAMKAEMIRRTLRGLSEYTVGYAHHPQTIQEIAKRNGLSAEFVSSMYYEYRYHAILKGL